jgi:aspartyl-tRNA(Asn)/glutamyl-tRNA(Gln) amidotransferase subunit A
MLAEYVPPYDATVVERLREAGATVVGKTNMDEFGMGTTTETSYFGPTHNPVDTDRVPGGSSGGSAAAVAAGEADLALGSDTGGSIRCPAAFCGVVGIKPTYGLVSRYGLVAYANSLEQIGPIAGTVEEAAALLDVLAGPDPNDATTQFGEGEAAVGDWDGDGHPATDADYAAAADGDVDGLRIGVPTELVEGADEGVVETFHDALDDLESQGATVREVSLPSVEYAVEAYYVIAMGEASSNLARFDGVRYGHSGGYDGDWNEAFATAREEGFGDEVKRRILLGTYALSAGYQDKYYRKAQDARAWVKRDFDEALEGADVLASPTMPVPPFEIGESLDDPLQMYLADANTTPVNLADLPAISVPAGRADGLPVGIQFVGPAFGEKRVIRAGSALA